MTDRGETGRKEPLKVGLTGGIGSGKTTVAAMFGDLGVPGIDADEISRAVTRPGQIGYQGIVDLFGAEVVAADGGLRRRRLREIVFADPALREKLEALIHPLVRAEILRLLKEVRYHYCLVSVPLLLEKARAADYIDRVLVVDAPEELQMTRAGGRDKTTKADIAKIMKTQVSREQRLAKADDVIDNSGDLDFLKRQVAALHRKYLRLSQ